MRAPSEAVSDAVLVKPTALSPNYMYLLGSLLVRIHGLMTSCYDMKSAAISLREALLGLPAVIRWYTAVTVQLEVPLLSFRRSY